MVSETKSEQIIPEKVDVCIADGLIKLGGGLLTGAVFSLLLFKRRAWPIVFGMGVGTGMGISNCQHRLNMPFLLKAERLQAQQKLTPTTVQTEESDTTNSQS